MNTMKSINKIILFLSILAFAGSCIKEQDVNKGIENKEKSLIKLPQAAEEINTIALDANPGSVEVKVLEIRRDAVSNADLNKAITVKIALNNAMITAFNTANGSAIKPFTGYTNATENPFDGTNWTVNFAAGEFVKFIKIKLDPSTIDLSSRYALGFKVADAGGEQISTSNQALVEIAIKNKFDGVYKLTGTLVDAAVPTITALSPVEIALVTTGANTVVMYDFYWPGYYHPIMSGTSRSVYGAYAPVFKIDANNNVIEVVNIYGQPASNGRSARLDPTGVNKWYPAEKKLVVKYLMLQPGTTVRTTYDEVFTYVGPR